MNIQSELRIRYFGRCFDDSKLNSSRDAPMTTAEDVIPWTESQEKKKWMTSEVLKKKRRERERERREEKKREGRESKREGTKREGTKREGRERERTDNAKKWGSVYKTRKNIKR